MHHYLKKFQGIMMADKGQSLRPGVVATGGNGSANWCTTVTLGVFDMLRTDFKRGLCQCIPYASDSH